MTTNHFVAKACGLIESGLEAGEKVSLNSLAAELGLSPFHLQRRFKSLVGLSPRRYGEMLRSGRLKTLLKESDGVTGALYSAGYGSSSRLYEKSDRELGMTPGEYRRGGEGLTIRFATTKSLLGRLLVARTEKGVCFVSLGESDDVLREKLRREFPAAAFQASGEGLKRETLAVLRRLAGKPAASLPLDLQGTAFQRRVWEELSRIPRGSTRTYSQVARAVGRPKAARAVASACARNPVPIVVPCHRVVRRGGGLGGYSLGLARKKALLKAEGVASR